MLEEAPMPPEQTPAPQPVKEITFSRDEMLSQLLDWGSKFVASSADWRRNSYEARWALWSRNADSIYDPALASKKEKWQSKAVWPLTAAHLENALANLFHIEFGAKPALEYKARMVAAQPQMPGMPPPVDQGELIRDLVLLEREKGEYERARNLMNGDRGRYGSGFMRSRFETRIEPRIVKVPQYAPIDPFDRTTWPLFNGGQRQVVGYEDQVQEVVTYRGTVFEHISIWDIFPDPQALDIKGSTIAHRYYTTLGEIVKGALEGYYLPECVSKLKDLPSDEDTPADQQEVQGDRQIADARIERPDYAKRFECYEIQAKLPKKWVLIKGEEIDDPEALVPARVRIKKGICVVSVEVNDTYDGEPDIEKDDYMPVAGQFYGMGVPEMLKDTQLITTETVNQRLDTGSIGLSQKFAGYAEYLVDPKDFDENRNFIRLKRAPGTDPVPPAAVLSRLDMGQPDKSAFIEVQEAERISQDRTSVTRATLGTSEQVSDSNQTLGGQKIQQGVTQDKMSYIAKLSEYGFQKRMSHRVWSLIYQNYQPEDYAMALGMEKAAQLMPMSPEAVSQNFALIPKGVFEAENKGERQAILSNLDAQYAMEPWFNRLGVFKQRISQIGIPESLVIFPEAEAMQIMSKAQMIGQGMAQQMVQQKEQADMAKGAKGPK